MFPIRDMTRNQATVTLAIIVGAIIVGIGLILTQQTNSTSPGTPTPTVTPGPITIEGTIVCLPHKNIQGPQTLECAYGLKADSGEYYGLRGLDQDTLIDGTLTVQTRVLVSGTAVPPADNQRYGIVGSIDIVSIEVLSAAT